MKYRLLFFLLIVATGSSAQTLQETKDWILGKLNNRSIVTGVGLEVKSTTFDRDEKKNVVNEDVKDYRGQIVEFEKSANYRIEGEFLILEFLAPMQRLIGRSSYTGIRITVDLVDIKNINTDYENLADKTKPLGIVIETNGSSIHIESFLFEPSDGSRTIGRNFKNYEYKTGYMKSVYLIKYEYTAEPDFKERMFKAIEHYRKIVPKTVRKKETF